MAETLQEKIERLIGDFDEPFNFRNVLYTTLEKVFVAQGSPHGLPSPEPAAMHAAVAAFVASTVERLGLGLVIRVVAVHDLHYWRELYRITVFWDEAMDTYVLQFFDRQSILTVARVSRSSVDWGCPFEEGSPQEVSFNGFVLGLCRGVPLRETAPARPAAVPADDGDISIVF